MKVKTALAVTAALLLGGVAFLAYPLLGGRGAFAILIAGLALVGVVATGLLVTLWRLRGEFSSVARKTRRRARRAARMDASLASLTAELDGVEQRLRRAMQRYAEEALTGVHSNLARFEAALEDTLASKAPASESTGVGGFEQVVQEAIKAQDRLYGQIEGLAYLHALLNGGASMPPLSHTGAARPDTLALLAALVDERKPGLMVACGAGVPTLVLAQAARTAGAGHVVALEHVKEQALATTTLLEKHGLDDLATIHVADLVPYQLTGDDYAWYDVAGLEFDRPIDLLFVDGPPGPSHEQGRYPALPLLEARLSNHAVIVMDGSHRPAESEVADRWCREFRDLSRRELDTQRGTVVFERASTEGSRQATP